MPAWNRRANEIFLVALDIQDLDERRSHLDAACVGDIELRRQVGALLAAHEQGIGLLEHSTDMPDATGAYVPSGSADLDIAQSECIGTTIGPYRILELLGEGGMGAVFLAEQHEPIKRCVALKIIKAGMDSAQIIARFEAERQALALMDHPNIAKVLDAGTTRGKPGGVSAGRPYFAMELVHGVSITRYCDREHLTPEERLELFIPVCQAVQHAHQKGIIHRDLKPSNVLVGLYDGKPIPKVIDFGVAKATQQRLTDRTMFTEAGAMVGTLEYMAPEQAELNNLDIDTRADVYSLGVLLYELLAGSPPFTSKQLRSAAFTEMLRMIREVEPPKPSTKLSSSNELSSIAANRKLEPRRLTRLVRGDLDWIVMKCLEKDRARRYETANGLAMEIRLYLADEPVQAGPPSAGYRIRKFVRRNKGGVIAAAAVAAALLVGIVGFAWQARIAQRERNDAQTERDTAQTERNRAVAAESETKKRADELQKVSDFQGEMLRQVDPTQAGKLLTEDVRVKLEAALLKAGVPEAERTGQLAAFTEQWKRVNATDAARELIDRAILKPAVAAIDKQFADQPVVDAVLRQVLADRYGDMGLHNAAMPLQERALATRRSVLGEKHSATLKSINAMGYLLINRGKPNEAEPYLREGLDKSRRELGEEHPDTLLSINKMGLLLVALGKLSDAEPYHREALEKSRRVLGEEHPDTLNAIGNMGVLLWDLGRLSAAEPYLREALVKCRRVKGEEHPETLQSLNNLAVLLYAQGKLSAAAPFYREALDKQRRVLGEEHPDTLNTIGNFGSVLHALGRLTEAEPFLREALEKKRRVRGPEHLDTLSSMANIGVLLKDQGKLSEAEPYLREALVTRRRVLGEEHQHTQFSIVYLGSLLVAQGKHAEAVELLATFEAGARKAFTGGNAWRLASLLVNLGKARAGLREFAAAEANLLESQPMFVTTRGPTHQDTRDCTRAVLDLYTAWHAAQPTQGHDVKVAEWKAKLEAMKK